MCDGGAEVRGRPLRDHPAAQEHRLPYPRPDEHLRRDGPLRQGRPADHRRVGKTGPDPDGHRGADPQQGGGRHLDDRDPVPDQHQDPSLSGIPGSAEPAGMNLFFTPEGVQWDAIFVCLDVPLIINISANRNI